MRENICDFASMADFIKAEREAKTHQEFIEKREFCKSQCEDFLTYLKDMQLPNAVICDILLEKMSEVAVAEGTFE